MYKLLHRPTGLYYQPHKHKGSNLSKRGKIYQTNIHGLSSNLKYGSDVYVYVEKDSKLHKDTASVLNYELSMGNQVRAKTNINDWSIEQLHSIDMLSSIRPLV